MGGRTPSGAQGGAVSPACPVTGLELGLRRLGRHWVLQVVRLCPRAWETPYCGSREGLTPLPVQSGQESTVGRNRLLVKNQCVT